VHWVDLALAMMGMVAAGAVVVAAGRGLHLQGRISYPFSRLALLTGACGLAGYLYYGLGLPGSGFVEGITPGLRGLVIGFVCGLLPLVAAVGLSRWGRAEKRQA